MNGAITNVIGLNSQYYNQKATINSKVNNNTAISTSTASSNSSTASSTSSGVTSALLTPVKQTVVPILDLENLPSDVKYELEQLELELQEGDLTQKGYEKKKAKLVAPFYIQPQPIICKINSKTSIFNLCKIWNFSLFEIFL